VKGIAIATIAAAVSVFLSVGPLPADAATQNVPETNASVARLNSRAVDLYKKGDFKGAIAILDQVVARYPTSGLAYANRGGVYFKMGNFDEAIKDYTQAIGLGRNEAVVILNRGTAYSTKGDYERALEDCNAIIRINPRNAVAYRVCGVAYDKLGDRERAFANLNESIRLDARAAKSFMARGQAYAHFGQPEKALADLTEAGKLDASARKDKAFVAALSAAQAAVASKVAPQSVAEAATTPSADIHPAPDGETRVALVIGNSAYSQVPRLPNPVADAEAIAKSLRDVGFKTVRLSNDLGATAMRQALNDFANEAAGADWAMVYYAGHGIEVNGTNYLVPVDAKLKTDRAVQFEAVPLDAVLTSVEGARKLHLVILDACRDNPFLRDMTRTVASRSIGRGLARVEPESGATLVAYAAKAGQVALDGTRDGANSPFAAALIRNMSKPGVEIRKYFGLVRDDVLASTSNGQEPFVYGSLGGKDYFFRKP